MGTDTDFPKWGQTPISRKWGQTPISGGRGPASVLQLPELQDMCERAVVFAAGAPHGIRGETGSCEWPRRAVVGEMVSVPIS
jgi:hypothetical protein